MANSQSSTSASARRRFIQWQIDRDQGSTKDTCSPSRQTLTLRTAATPQEITQADDYAYKVQLHQGSLVVEQADKPEEAHLISYRGQQFLADWLQYSSAHSIRTDPAVGESRLAMWAALGERSSKAVYIQVPPLDCPQSRRPLAWAVKRSLDWLAAWILLFLLSPVFIGLALLIWVDSPGSVFFQQWRVGEQGRLFKIYKFRTMIQDAEQQHSQVMANQQGLHKREDDPRITSPGRWMRKHSLDELPQLLNVLKGEMSLVGPRPWALYDATRISPSQQMRLNALPGMTGDWQVKARSNSLDIEEVTDQDLRYLHHWSLRWDFKILLLTASKVISGFGAY